MRIDAIKLRRVMRKAEHRLRRLSNVRCQKNCERLRSLNAQWVLWLTATQRDVDSWSVKTKLLEPTYQFIRI